MNLEDYIVSGGENPDMSFMDTGGRQHYYIHQGNMK
jgi:hypothetical protein